MRKLAPLLLLTLAGCACEPPPLTNPNPDAGEGEGEGEPDAGVEVDAGFDAGPPPTPAELARELCLAVREGNVNGDLQSTQSVAPARCLPTDPIADTAQLGAELEPGACTQVDELFRLFEASEREGRIVIDEDQLAACVAAGRAARAEHDTQAEFDARQAALAALAASPTCRGIVDPLLGPDEVCTHNLECPAGTRCEADPLDSAILRCIAPALEGARCDAIGRGQRLAIRSCADNLVCVLNLCTRPVTEGLSCAGDVPCEEGLVCDGDDICSPPPVVDGGPVSPLDGEPCEANGLPCAARCSVCVPLPDSDAGPTRMCAPPGIAGELCDNVNHCAPGTRCNAGACADLLGDTQPCTPGACALGLACVDPPDAGPTCAPEAALGESCADRPCGEGFCTLGVCLEGIAGDTCGSDASCASDHLCVTNRCVVAPREGAPCTDDGRCESGLFCIDDRCRAPPGPDQTCFFADAGPDALCDDTAFCADGTCVIKGDPGTACTADNECVSGNCLDTLTCAALGASCFTGRDTFAQLLGLAGLLAFVRLRRRRDGRRRG